MSIFELIAVLFKHVGLLVAGAFMLLTISPVREVNFRRPGISHRVFLIIFFGLFGILGTYSGEAIFNSIANLRAMAVITAGLFGGPVVGFGAGLIAAAHRFAIDPWGFSVVACCLATIIEGTLAGGVQSVFKERALNWRAAALLAFLGEILHMGMVLLFSKPFAEAQALVQVIALPMIIGNTLGAALFVHVIVSLQAFRERKESDQTQKIFDIANTTVGYLRSGLNADSAQAMARVIHEKLPVAAVSVTNATHVMAHEGQGSDHHLAGRPIVTRATWQVISKGEAIFLKEKEDIGCNNHSCPFLSAIIVPLKKGGRIVGTLKFYGSSQYELNSILFEIAKGLKDLFSIQLELEDIQVKDRMLAHAEIRHLQAQINPHFLFNSLNTIASFCRTAPTRARDLILELSFYMRKNLDSSRGFICLADELEQINAYLAIEKARFGELIHVEIEVEDGCRDWPIPSLIIQPLVENAIKHGLQKKDGGGTIGLFVGIQNNLLKVAVKDDGMGIPPETLSSLLVKKEIESHHEGIGLRNSNYRLEQIYGPEHAMKIDSACGRGTTISFSIPMIQELAHSDPEAPEAVAAN